MRGTIYALTGTFTKTLISPEFMLHIRHKMSLQKLDEEELRLANQLKALCTLCADERKANLCSTTRILHRMGCLYTEKAKLTAGVEQKLNLIKAATLLHAARVRAEKFLEMIWATEEILPSIKAMESFLMETCAGCFPASLTELSREVLLSFETWRSEEKESLKLLKIIENETISEDEAKRKREDKISRVKELLKGNSENYRTQMRKVANHCKQSLGEAPCNYVIVGLGSLARDEVTLYSDFEHVIILEEGVQDEEDYEKILEYFRWFSVIFHIIIIGMGETIIPSIGIESLNDLYSEDKSKNWFYDSYTPSGISFDGMMPHACKIPIGRQRTTANKNFVLELIKPLSKMVSFLTEEENMTNGYNLKEVLYKTCYIFGDEELYHEFEKRSEEEIEKDSERITFLSISQRSNEDFRRFDSLAKALDGYSPVLTKVSFYRPLSVIIGILSRAMKTNCKSGFENVKRFVGQFSDYKQEILEAFSVACELRLKIYADGHGNRDIVYSPDIKKYIGMSCMENCTSVIEKLVLYFTNGCFQEKAMLSTNRNNFIARRMFGRVQPSELLYTRLGSKPIRREESRTTIHDTLSHEMLTPFFTKDVVDTQLEVMETPGHVKFPSFFLSNPDVLTGDYNEQKHHATNELDIDRVMSELPKSMIEFIHNLFCNYSKDDSMSFIFVMWITICLHSCLVNDDEALREKLKKTLKTIPKANEINYLVVTTAINMCLSLQTGKGWIQDSVECLKFLEEIAESRRLSADPTLLMMVYTPLAVKANFLAGKEADELHEKLAFFEKALQICILNIEQGIPDESYDTYHNLYFLAFDAFLECFDSNPVQGICKLSKVLLEAPKSIQDSNRVRGSVVSHILHWCKHFASTIEGTIESLHFALVASSITSHPLTYPLLTRLSRDVQTVLRKTVFDGTFSTNDHFRISLVNIWRRLHSKKTDPSKDYSKFLDRVYNFVCLRTYQRLNRFIENIPQTVLPRNEDASTNDLKKGLELYKTAEFSSALKVFWRIFNQDGADPQKQKLSIILFCNSLLLSMGADYPSQSLLFDGKHIALYSRRTHDRFGDQQKFSDELFADPSNELSPFLILMLPYLNQYVPTLSPSWTPKNINSMCENLSSRLNKLLLSIQKSALAPDGWIVDELD